MAAPATRQLKGFKLCPVCGCRYQGTLDDHLNELIKRSGFNPDNSDGISRCDWRLMEARIFRTVGKLRDDGWKLAGTHAARTAVVLGKTRPDLAIQTTSGSIETRVHRMYLDPKNDLKAWWIKRWAYPIALVSGWSLMKRAQVIKELADYDEHQDVVEAAYRIGGWEAVKTLEGGAIPARCDLVYGNPVDAITSRGHTRLYDRCILAKGHDETYHQGEKSGVTWGNGWVANAGVEDADRTKGAEYDDSGEIGLERLFRTDIADGDW